MLPFNEAVINCFDHELFIIFHQRIVALSLSQDTYKIEGTEIQNKGKLFFDEHRMKYFVTRLT